MSPTLDCLFPKHVFEQISSLDITVAEKVPDTNQEQPRMIFSWSAPAVLTIQLPVFDSQRSSLSQTTFLDHRPLFLDTRGDGYASEDVLAVTCYLFSCKRWIHIDMEAKQIEIFPNNSAVILNPGMTLCPGAPSLDVD